jgi:hypothetical protein
MSGPQVLPATLPVTGGAFLLADNGGSLTVALAVSIVAGLLTWGALYAYANR